MYGFKLVDSEIAEWQFENFSWLIDNLSSGPGLPDSQLWLPTPDHFPSKEDSEYPGQNLADHIFHLVSRQCGFGPDTIFDLVRIDSPQSHGLGGLAMVKTGEASACGMYAIKPAKFGKPKETIWYDASLEESPSALVATFSHELAHALHNRTPDPVEIDPELYELFTDLTAIYLGYGIFLANERFSFSQFQSAGTQGWQARGAGYLPEADMVFATAIFMSLKEIPLDKAAPYLKPKLRKMLKKAFKQLSHYGKEIEALKLQTPKASETSES